MSEIILFALYNNTRETFKNFYLNSSCWAPAAPTAARPALLSPLSSVSAHGPPTAGIPSPSVPSRSPQWQAQALSSAWCLTSQRTSGAGTGCRGVAGTVEYVWSETQPSCAQTQKQQLCPQDLQPWPFISAVPAAGAPREGFISYQQHTLLINLNI